MAKTDTLLTLLEMGLEKDPIFSALVLLYQNHCKALKEIQSSNGGWHNVVTSEEAFVETSGTAMYLFSFVKGVEHGWIDKAEFEDSIEKAWSFIESSILDDGSVKDVIMGTGVLLEEELYDRSRDYKSSGPGLGAVLRSLAAFASYKKIV
jgi:unsaturated rhamnogalacturonyl hydrolase